MSGHSKWATIKHQKGAKDKARGKLFAKLAKVVGPFGAHFRKGYSLSEREREIAVNIVNSKVLDKL